MRKGVRSKLPIVALPCHIVAHVTCWIVKIRYIWFTKRTFNSKIFQVAKVNWPYALALHVGCQRVLVNKIYNIWLASSRSWGIYSYTYIPIYRFKVCSANKLNLISKTDKGSGRSSDWKVFRIQTCKDFISILYKKNSDGDLICHKYPILGQNRQNFLDK